MKTFLSLLIVACSIASSHAKYYDGTILFTDGKSITGLVESPFGGDYLFFKASEKAEAEKIEAAKVSSVTFVIDGKEKEYHQHKVYLGWKQVRISDPTWLEVVEKGVATLYVVRSSLSTPSNQQQKAGFLDYYCIRKGEPAAKLIAQVSSMNNNQTFRAKAPAYFADYPELAAKIESKEYTWKDLEPVVQEYNKWAKAK
jgi:hypothetical protein